MENAIQSAIDRFALKDCPLIAMSHTDSLRTLQEPGHRLIVAKDGLYKEVRRLWLYSIVRLANAATPFGALAQKTVLRFRMPKHLLDAFYEGAVQALPNETAAWVVWNDIDQTTCLRWLNYNSRSSGHIEVNRPVLGPNEHLVLDIHSHGNGAAFFSSTDDADDIASNDVKVVAVVGCVGSDSPQWCFRICVEGHVLERTSDVEFGELP